MESKSRNPPETTAAPARLYAAFATVYIIWGSTYLAIRIGVTEIPPFFMTAVRYLIMGAVLYPLARSRYRERPTRKQWASALLMGALLPAAGNGFLTWAEQTVPSGIAALLVTMVPLWMVIFEWLRPGGTKPGLRTSTGVILGFGGILVLLAPWQQNGHVNLLGAGVLMTGSVCWAAGSVASRHISLPRVALLGTAMQSICGGMILVVVGSAMGELSRVHLTSITHRGWFALAYLTVFGSLITYPAYTWLLSATSPARVATYAFVNPVIAVVLGWLFAGERITPRILIAMPIIIIGVVLVIAASGSDTSPADATCGT